MSKWETESALMQAEVDLLTLNERDRDLIGVIERRMKHRSKLIKMLRRHFRKQGLVSIPSGEPYWLPRDSIER